ncbi:MAG: hypothetical protein E3K32_00620 [wastewater metagenome]|nr:hypothetical protein [Candidatus Loosdrechtia aerotolerans]
MCTCNTTREMFLAKSLLNKYSDFWNTEERSRKITNVLNDVYTIDYKTTDSELAAMLMEFSLIKHCQPGLNCQVEVHERTARYGNLRNFSGMRKRSGNISVLLNV